MPQPESHRRWKNLYRVGGVAALIAAVVFRRNLDTEYMLLRNIGVIKAGPATAPATIADWFSLLQDNRLLGLTLLNLFDIVNYALVGLMFLALCVALRRVSASFTALAALLGFLGIAVYFAANQAFTMLSLSNQYAVATTDTQRSQLLAAGQAVLAMHRSATYTASSQSGGIYMSFLLITLAGLLISLLMLRSELFGKGIAYMGIAANISGLGYYVMLAFAPAVTFIPISISAIFLLIWYLLIGRKLLLLGRNAKEKNK